MKTVTQPSKRERVTQSRRPPSGPWSRRVTYEGTGEIEAVAAEGPVELILEATNDDGELSAWFDDFWWVDVLTLYQKRAVTLHIAPTRDAVLHPVVLHQLEMLRRVEPQWQSVGYLLENELSSMEQVKALAAAPYHELRIITDRAGVAPSPEAGRLAGELAQGSINTVGRRPLVVRVESDDPVARRMMGTTTPTR